MSYFAHQPTAAALCGGPEYWTAIPQTRKMKRANVCAQQVAQNTTDAMDNSRAHHSAACLSARGVDSPKHTKSIYE
ncbi:predicted protein [Lichtheimia corymbifera JMRC:FSU:9682]|uniref:Uncharacterized protein n=1 Tax=Lichtheimia corymbifera JMRC:FSU:9682 TaxID=1263082 RepID=A0A068RHS2_9FUNG|nr:predicted protein [Lichtheimia corymbifera JMRC:FSU:9682]